MPNKRAHIFKIVLIVLSILVFLGLIAYGFYSYRLTIKNLKKANENLASTVSSNQADFQKRLDDLENALSNTNKYNTTLSAALLTEQQRNTTVGQQVASVTNTVGNLEKLSQTDPELLKQYSKVYFLNEHYVPISLASIDSKYLNNPARKLQIHANVAPFLASLLSDANSASLSLQIDSAYRSFGTQAVLKSSYRVIYGAGTANSFSAEQGYSEHQLGTAVDFTTPSIGGGLSGFDKTSEYSWLLNNAYKYGFVISYPKDNPSYMFEPWHWRFVGKALASYIHQNNTYFYSMDQRIIETYLGNIFDS